MSSGLAQQALLCSPGCPSHKRRLCETPTARKRDAGLKCAENIPENAGPFLRGAATAEAGPSFSALAPQVWGGSGPSPRSPKGSPRLGSERAPAPCSGNPGGSRRPEAWPDPARHPDRHTPFTRFWLLESHPWGPSGLPSACILGKPDSGHTKRLCSALKRGQAPDLPVQLVRERAPGRGMRVPHSQEPETSTCGS